MMKYTDIDDITSALLKTTMVMTLPNIPRKNMNNGTVCQNEGKELCITPIGTPPSNLLVCSTRVASLDPLGSAVGVVTSMVSEALIAVWSVGI